MAAVQACDKAGRADSGIA